MIGFHLEIVGENMSKIQINSFPKKKPLFGKEKRII